MVGAQLGGVCAGDGIHEVSLAGVFLECVTHLVFQVRNERLTNLAGTARPSFDDVFDCDC